MNTRENLENLAVQTLSNFMNTQGGDLLHLALELLGAEDAAFVVVSSEGTIVSQTEGAWHLLQQRPLRSIYEVLDTPGRQAIQSVLTEGGQSSFRETLEGQTFDVEVRALESGALLYFAPTEQAPFRLPSQLSQQIVSALSHIMLIVQLFPKLGKTKSAELLDAIEQDSLRIYRGISHLNSLLSHDEFPSEVHWELCDLSAVCRKMIARCKEACAHRGRTVTLTLEAPSSCLVVCSERLLIQAVLNLITNALRSPEVTEVALSLAHSGGKVILSVSDNGSGIDPNQLERLYTGWKHVPNEWEQIEYGAQATPCGLGLPFVRRVAGWHSGALLMERPSKHRTIFRLVFPDNLHPDSLVLRQGTIPELIDIYDIELSVL